MYQPWTVKYKPKTLKEVVGNKEAIQKFVEWVKSWDRGIPPKRAAFLYGPPGVGKTVTVEALANDLKMELVEKNASDYRTEEAVKRFAGLASQYGSLFGTKRIILFDELDGLTGTADKGGVKAITDITKTAQCPIVLIANNAFDPRFAFLRNYCLLIEFKKPSTTDVLKHLKGICLKEGIEAEENALKFIAQRSEGDIRSAVTDLQALAQGKKRLTYDDVSWLGFRDRQETIFTVLRMILYGKTCEGAKRAVDMADVDTDMLFEWIYENVPAHLTDPHDLARAMDALSMADVYRGRIRKTQDWSFVRYVVDFMSAGVAMARVNTKTSGWTPFRFPERIQALSRSKEERAMQLEIGRKIKRRCHISATRAAKEVLPYLRIIFKNNVKMAAGIAKWLDLTPEMIEYVAESKEKAAAINKLLS
ncbi:MAG: replication factor C large subunit [Candidatus Bathyarchaeota archaeon]|nr:replication factor C large subunit [Candidatus Bathyarchaeota archaeon]MDW8040206.1 replication factor C large subunit [Nitrososphaerota archaeon]